MHPAVPSTPRLRPAEQGFMLLGLIVTIFLILLVLGVAAPRLAKSLRRDREVEAVRRGNQYVRAIQLYYRKTGHYPGSIDQLEKTNNVRYLRQRYADPMTGKADWRLIHVGEAKTTVKGFFGQPLAGLPGAAGSLGSLSSSVSNSQPGASSASSTSNASSSFGSSTFGSSGSTQDGTGSTFGGTSSGSFTGTSTGTSGSTGSATQSSSGSSFGSLTGSGSSTGSGGIGSQSATSFTGGGAPFVGVGSSASGDSILVLNEQKTYPTWEFLYDPRVEQLKAKAATLGGPASAGSSSSSGFGSSSAGSSFNNTVAPGSSTSPTAPTSGTSTAPPL